MVYVMSDIHGCYDKYRKMLDKIALTKEDTLYVLGDIVDRGPDGVSILLDIAKRKNIVLLRGNHEEMAYPLLKNLYMLEEGNCPKELINLYKIWFSDGGKETLEAFLKLSESEQRTVMDVIDTSIIKTEIEVNGHTFLLAHTVPEVDTICDYEEWTSKEFLWGEPDYEEIYFDDKYIVTGHTPTGCIDKNAKGRIWQGNNHIAIDCGTVYGNPLGCICLDSFEEFYVV